MGLQAAGKGALLAVTVGAHGLAGPLTRGTALGS
jgi:hypothetical protein